MKFIIGSDEVGYGAWAGPLLVVAVGIPLDWDPPMQLDDSKKLTAKQREEVTARLRDEPHLIATLAFGKVEDIDKFGVRPVLINAHEMAIAETAKRLKMKHGLDCVANAVADGNFPISNAVSVVKGDTKFDCIKAASIMAKYTRDLYMTKMEPKHPCYSFGSHKGYGTSDHHDELRESGPIEGIHRRSYNPMKEMKNWVPQSPSLTGS